MRFSFAAVLLCATAVAAQEPAPEAAPIAAPSAEPAVAPTAQPDVPIEVSEPKIDTVPWYKRFTPYGYAKVGVFYTFALRDEQIPGGNGGFRVANLRLGTIFQPIDDLEVVASIEAAAPNARADDPTTGSRIVQLRDAYAEYTVFKGLLVRAGQFKAPFWAETLLDDAHLPFVHRSVVSEGYGIPEYAAQREGLSMDRQVGVQLSSRKIGGKAIGIRYAVAVVNGNGANQLFNDNNAPAPVGRLEAEIFEHVTVGVNGYYNPKSEGVRPTRLISEQIGYGADILAHALGFTILVGYVGKSTSYPGTALAADSGTGMLGQLHYLNQKTGIAGAIRFALLDPSSSDPADNVSELALMLSWSMKAAPLRVLLQYTHREEAAGVSVANDGLDAMLQVTW